MAYRIRTTKQFDKSAKLCQRRGLPMYKLTDAMRMLANNGRLPLQYRPHKLRGKYQKVWECHLEPDWLLLWQQDDDGLTMLFTNTGTHSDIFDR